MTRKTRVYALGGSILAPDRPSATYAGRFAAFLLERLALGEDALVVTGGGGPARAYIEAARTLGAPEEALDLLGIDATRINARFLATVAEKLAGPVVCPEVHTDVAGAARALRDHRIVIMGGTLPGHSTDFVAASLASATRADHLYVLTNVDGVYTADPRSDPDAERLPELTSSRLVEIVGAPEWTAGMKGVVDPKCARHVHEHRLPLTVLDGRAVDRLRAVLAGETGIGSHVAPDAR